jgi:hypothetical protein
MPETKTYSLLLGGLLRASDMPGLERQVVPHASDVEAAAGAVLGESLRIIGGDRDPSTDFGLGGPPHQKWPAPRRYGIEASSDIPTSQLYAGLVAAILDVAPLPSGFMSNCTVRIALEDDAGRRIGDGTYEIPQGGGRRRLLSPSGMGGIALGALAGAALGGPVGVVIGAAIGGAAGEVLERQFPSVPDRKPRQA